jgi:hypothetical protein
MNSRLKYQVFRSGFESWDSLFIKASEFANSIGRENVLNISHSCHNNDGVVTVWYWEEEISGQMFELNRVNFGE